MRESKPARRSHYLKIIGTPEPKTKEQRERENERTRMRTKLTENDECVDPGADVRVLLPFLLLLYFRSFGLRVVSWVVVSFSVSLLGPCRVRGGTCGCGGVYCWRAAVVCCITRVMVRPIYHDIRSVSNTNKYLHATTTRFPVTDR